MTEFPGASQFIPGSRSLAALRAAAEECRGCDLWERSTQVVFSEGPRNAGLALVGEQPGDHEDIEGRLFVGPAGRVLDDALERAGIDRSSVYLTNAVKHFRWKARGKRRLAFSVCYMSAETRCLRTKRKPRTFVRVFA